MSKYFVMIYRQILPVYVSRIPLGVSRHHPYPFQRDPSDCQCGREATEYNTRKGGGAVGPTGNSCHQFMSPRRMPQFQGWIIKAAVSCHGLIDPAVRQGCLLSAAADNDACDPPA
jgi:hypothetical protein